MAIIKFKCIRKHKRHQLNKQIDVLVAPVNSTAPFKDKVTGYIKDISRSGLGLILDNEKNIQGEIVIEMFFGKTKITSIGHVVHINENEHRKYRCGIKFENNAQPIIKFIEAHELIKQPPINL